MKVVRDTPTPLCDRGVVGAYEARDSADERGATVGGIAIDADAGDLLEWNRGEAPHLAHAHRG